MKQRFYRVSLIVLCFIVGNLLFIADGVAQTPSPTPTPEMTLTKTGSGAGVILVNEILACPVSCMETTIPFDEGSTLRIQGMPSQGSVLEGWQINGIPVTPASGSITVMPGDRVTAIFRLATPASSESCELLGDVDDDGVITIVDFGLVFLYVRGFPVTLPCPSSADVNCDGDITLDDAWLILRYVFGWIETFPCSPPVAEFSAEPLSGPVPLTVVFTNTSSGTITDYA